MPRYMLDTDSVSYALRGHGHVAERLLERRPAELCLSAITVAELRYGADLKASRKLHGLIDVFASGVAVLPLDDQAARRFGEVAAALRKRGAPIGAFDTLIAAHALAAGVTLVTGNAKHYARVPGLATESWV
jgi:tRNA(fMet)-specific endonuclease VapC